MVFGQDVGTDHDENVLKGALFGSIWERNGARGSVRDAAGPQPLRSPYARIGAGGKARRARSEQRAVAAMRGPI